MQERQEKHEKWHLADAYGYLDDLGSKAYAWEFLRRNSDYRVAYRFIAAGVMALFAQHWSCVVDPDLRADSAPVAWLFTSEQS